MFQFSVDCGLTTLSENLGTRLDLLLQSEYSAEQFSPRVSSLLWSVDLEPLKPRSVHL